ncbi:MAG: hypothetical protein JKY66_06160 [Spongiibacteraceae bacterium]|nr:hypothetical protein [Spongiibacteraceae bacterium]
MTLVIKRSASLLILLLLTSCALLKPSFDTPTVTIKSFRVLPATQVGPQFEIELHIINPNRSALEFVGVSYTVSIEEYPLLSGVSN